MNKIRVPAQGAFDESAAIAMLTAHAIPGAEVIDGRTYRRVIDCGDGPAQVSIALDSEGLTATTTEPSRDPADLASRICRWFDLDTDLEEINRAFASDPLIGPLATRRPGLRLIGYPDEFEAVASTVLGQQVSLAAARTFADRLVAEFGLPAGDLRGFPSAATLAELDVDEIRACAGVTGMRARTLSEVARRWADGPLLAGTEPSEARDLLLGIPGVGPWTADYLMVRALQHPDTFAPGDLVARRALGLDQKTAAAYSEKWAPFRSYALLHLWTEEAYLGVGK